MDQTDFYYTIEQTSLAELKEKDSKFLAYAFAVNSQPDFKEKLKKLKELHPKANHHCFAYRIGTDGNLFRVSDDGEPSGTGGKPILGQIDSKQLTNTAIVVVRYFGGTLLGIAGLTNAYKTAASLVLQITPVIQKPIEVFYAVEFDYTQMNHVMTILKQFQCSITEKDIQLFCRIKTGIPKNRLHEVLFRFEYLYDVRLKKLN